MRIAQIAPLAEAVPPKLYGGTERVVFWLTEELVRRGHDVHLFASGDSITSARLWAGAPNALRLAGVRDHVAYTLVMLDIIRRHADEFDILHFHIDVLQFPIFQQYFDKCITTLHGRLDLPDCFPIYRAFPTMPLVSISDHQRKPMPPVRWVSTIHHGIPRDSYRLQSGVGKYLAFLGRISPEKRADRAIELAKRTGVPLKLAAKVDPVDAAYFAAEIEPLLDHPLIDYVGEIGEDRKEAFLSNALALIFPIDWPEPFGLVMIEAMACGTPVIAWCNGSVPEVIDHGRTGLIVETIDEAVDAVRRIGDFDRIVIRRVFEQRFSACRMASDYLAVYEELVAQSAERGTEDALEETEAQLSGLAAPLVPLAVSGETKLARV